MKYKIILLVTLVVELISCNNTQHKSARIKSFIAGTYIRSFEGEYSKGNDTLIINQPNADNNYYIIQHSSSFQRKRNKKLLPTEHKTENWIAIFDDQDNVLIEQKNGKLFSFLRTENALLLGSGKFQKIN